MTKDEAIQAVIDIAEEEIGYLEKRSNSQLDSKTANAGSGNYTKYWRDTYPQYQGQPWCADFVSWCFMKAFGLDNEFFGVGFPQCVSGKHPLKKFSG